MGNVTLRTTEYVGELTVVSETIFENYSDFQSYETAKMTSYKEVIRQQFDESLSGSPITETVVKKKDNLH